MGSPFGAARARDAMVRLLQHPDRMIHGTMTVDPGMQHPWPRIQCVIFLGAEYGRQSIPGRAPGHPLSTYDRIRDHMTGYAI